MTGKALLLRTKIVHFKRAWAKDFNFWTDVNGEKPNTGRACACP